MSADDQDQPLTLAQARRAGKRLTEDRRAAQQRLKDAIDAKGKREGEYREALARQIAKDRSEYPATVAKDIARGRPHVVQAKTEAMVADGMVSVWTEELRLCDQRRATFHRDVEWSMKVAPDGSMPEQPKWGST